MKWLSLLTKILSILPTVVVGVEAVAKETGATGPQKKQMAIDALGLSSAVAQIVAPQYQPAIDAATQFAGQAIDGVVATFNAIKHPLFVSATAPPAAAPAAGQ